MKIAVVGTGLAGYAATHALLAQGHRVTVIDAGETLDAPRQAMIQAMRAAPPTEWDKIVPPHQNAGFKKTVFGSDYIYAGARPFAHTRNDYDGAVEPTYALGGHSVGWGAVTLAPDLADLGDWPHAVKQDLSRALSDAARLMPLSAESDDALARDFPLPRAPDGSLPMPALARDFLRRLENARPSLCAFGAARLAVQPPGANAGCRSCGRCLFGCVYGAIFSTAQQFEDWAREGRIQYVRGAVLRAEETGPSIDLLIQGQEGAVRQTFDKVFLAAGAINSPRIVLASQGLLDQSIPLLTCAKIVMPFLMPRAHPWEWPAQVSLANAFVEYKTDVNAPWVHAQIYVANDVILAGMRLGGSKGWRTRLARTMIERLMVAMIGLHSNASERLALRAVARPDGGADIVVTEPSPKSAPVIAAKRTAARVFGRIVRQAGGWAAGFARMDGRAGEGYHLGGSLPMRNAPQAPMQSDLMGRPYGFRHLHVVDSSVFPSLPGTSIGLLIMANAGRIARGAFSS